MSWVGPSLGTEDSSVTAGGGTRLGASRAFPRGQRQRLQGEPSGTEDGRAPWLVSTRDQAPSTSQAHGEGGWSLLLRGSQPGSGHGCTRVLSADRGCAGWRKADVSDLDPADWENLRKKGCLSGSTEQGRGGERGKRGKGRVIHHRHNGHVPKPT